ncbi:MAG: MFS transporter [Alphaproteobacteria bacterium]|nr:MFS transporter [Alphaproteobacteria bacterium]
MANLADISVVRRTLSVANFRNYTAGNFASQMGMWVQRIAVQWLTWELTHSPTWLGIIAFADFFPNIVMAPLAGALADRIDRLKAIRLYMWISGAITSAMAVLVMAGVMDITLLLILVVANGTAMAFNYPVRLSIIYALVDRETLTSAIGINAITFNIARIGGPALAGFIILYWGVGPAFALTAVSDILFIISLHAISLREDSGPKRERRPARDIPGEILEGFRYARSHPGIGPLLIILLATTLFARPFNDLFAGFADDVFGRGADGLAWLTGMLGLGAFIGSIFLAQRGGMEGLTRMLVTAVLIFAIALIGFTATDIFWFACLCTAVAGLSVVIVGVAEQTLLQGAVDSAMRGRILSLYTLIARGFPSIGALVMGTAASYVGLRLPVFLGALMCLGLWVWARIRQKRMAAILEAPPRRD